MSTHFRAFSVYDKFYGNLSLLRKKSSSYAQTHVFKYGLSFFIKPKRLATLVTYSHKSGMYYSILTFLPTMPPQVTSLACSEDRAHQPTSLLHAPTFASL